MPEAGEGGDRVPLPGPRRASRHGAAQGRSPLCLSGCWSTERLPVDAHGLDVDDQGHGTVVQQRLYQLIRKHGAIADSTIEITFPEGGVEAYVFTFG